MVGHNTTTNADELDKVGKKLFAKAWKGAVARDMIPKMSTGDVCIVNTHNSTQPGEHWTALAKAKDKLLGYDSFGRKIGLGVVDSELDAEQLIEEQDCGQRCLAWLAVFKRIGDACLMI